MCLRHGCQIELKMSADTHKFIFSCKEALKLDSFQGPKSEWMWLGMSDLKKEGTWILNSNAPVKYTNWNNGEPNGRTGENCGSYWGGGPHWNDMVCNYTWCPQPMCELILHGSA
jgi:hypothetical protein